MRRTIKPTRRVARAVLLVGEGDSEVRFLQHLKGLYVARGSGVAVTIKNARGKGAAHVVDFARRQSINAAYDLVAAMLDTDTDWNDKTRVSARRSSVQVLACEPCLEAVLLAAHGTVFRDQGTSQYKQEFARRFGGSASDATVYARHFDRTLVDEACARVQVLAGVLRLLQTGETAGRGK